MRYIIASFFFLLVFSLKAQDSKVTDPKNARLITTDIDNFWQMFDRLKTATSEKDTLTILKAHYLDKASLGLREYLEEIEVKQNRKDIAAEYLKMLRRYPKYIRSLREATKGIIDNKKTIYQALSQQKQLYANSYFPDTYFSIGFLNTTGKPLKSGLFIGVEITVTSAKVDTSEFIDNQWLIADVLPADRLFEVVVHENLHAQQPLLSNGCCSLLCQALLEGSAVLMVDLITKGKGLIGPAGVSREVFQTGESREKEVWMDFKNDMVKDDKSRWFLNDAGKYPSSMGYYVGYKICKSYYDNSTDKKAALKQMIEMSDCDAFLKESKYDEKFK